MATTHDPSYQTGIYVKQGGQELHLGNPVVGPDGTGAAVVWGPNSLAVSLTPVFTPAPGAATVCNLTIQVQDGLGNNVAQVCMLDVMFSDAATGAGLTAGAGTVAATTGVVVGSFTANKALRCQTDATGKLVLQITDAARTQNWPVVVNGLGVTVVGARILTANYG